MDKQGLDSFIIIKDQLDEHNKIVSTTVTLIHPLWLQHEKF